MKKGDSYIIPIDTDLDLRTAKKVTVKFSQGGRIILTKSGDDVVPHEDSVEVFLDGFETSLFESGRFIPIEIRAIYDKHTATSNVMFRPFNGTSTSDGRKCKCQCDSDGEDIVVDSFLSLESKNPVQNKVITEALNGKHPDFSHLVNEENNGKLLIVQLGELNVIDPEYLFDNLDVIHF